MSSSSTPSSSSPRVPAEPSPPPGTPPRAGTARGLRDALAGLARGGEEGASAEELADVLWMARLAGLEPGAGEPRPAEEPGPEPPRTPVPPARQGEDAPLPEPAPVVDAAAPPPGPPQPRVGLHPYAPARPGTGRSGTGDGGAGAGTGHGPGHVVRVAQPAALSGALDLARALRPLRRSVAAPGVPLLDEEATAQASGEAGHGRLVPVWRAPVRRRFSVDLLVDTGATMAVWHRLAAELCTVLERQGAFADVRCWALDTDGPLPVLAPFRRRHGHGGPGGHGRRTRPARWPGPLEDPTGRRVLLVLTDGVGPAWYGSALPDFLARVAGERPAAALQVLPRRLWHRTALRTLPVELRVPDPARPVPAVRTEAALPGRVEPRAVRWLPVMEVDGAWLAPWAELVGGRAPGWSPMLAAPLRGLPRPRRAVPAAPAPANAPAPPVDPAERVARLRAGTSPEAFRLACHLAAAPLSLPVMRLVQQATMPSSRQTDLAELFVSGVIVRRGAAGPDPDEVVYDFAPGVREELLAELTRAESMRVLDDVLTKVSGRVAATFGGTLDFRALAVRAGAATGGTGTGSPGTAGTAQAANGAHAATAIGTPGGTPSGEAAPEHVLPAESLPFAEVAVAVLSGAGGRHRALAERLSQAVAGRPPAPLPTPTVPPTPAGPDPDDASGQDTSTEDTSAGGTGPGPEPGRRLPPYPERLSPMPPIAAVAEPLIGRGWEMAELERLLSVPAERPRVVVIEGRIGMGAQRVAQEYVRRHGSRHSFVHWVDAGSAGPPRRPAERTLEAGLAQLGEALGGSAPDTADTWRRLAGYQDWLLVLDDLGPEHDIGAKDFLPAEGRGTVLVTTARVYDGRRRADAVIALQALSRAEIADHVRTVAGPALLARDRGTPSALNRLVARLSSLPATLAKVDVRAEFTRELGLLDRPGPAPVYTWLADHPQWLAGFGRGRLAVAGPGGPARLGLLAEGRIRFSRLPGHTGPVRALTTLARPDGGTAVAIAPGGRTVTVHDAESGAELFGVTASLPGDGGEGGSGTTRRGEGRLRTVLPSVTVLTSFARDDGRTVLVAGGTHGVQFWDGGTGAELSTPLNGRVRAVRAATVFRGPRDRLRLAVADPSGVGHVWDEESGEAVASPLAAALRGATALVTLRLPYRPDIVAAVDGGPTVALWDTATGASAGVIATGAPGGLAAVTVLASRRGASRIATASVHGLVQVWDVTTVVDPQDPYADTAGAWPEVPAATGGADTRAAAPEDGRDPEGGAAEDSRDARDLRRFLAWAVEETGGRDGVRPALLGLLVPGGAEEVARMLARGDLEPALRARVRVPADSVRSVQGIATRHPDDRRSRLIELLDRACPAPTADPATWGPYETLRPTRPWVRQTLGHLPHMAGAADIRQLVSLGTRWAWYHLLRGEFEQANDMTKQAVVSVKAAMERSAGTTSASLWDELESTGLTRDMERIALRAALALGDVDGVHDRAARIARREPEDPADLVEAHLARAEAALWKGDFPAVGISLAAASHGLLHAGLPAGHALGRRAMLLRARHAMAECRLRDAAGALTSARDTLAALLENATDQASAVERLHGASGRTADAPTDDPAFATPRMAEAALDAVRGELRLILADLNPRGRGRGRAAAAARFDLAEALGHPPSESLTDLARSVPEYSLHLYATLAEQDALLAFRRTSAGPLGTADQGAGFVPPEAAVMERLRKLRDSGRRPAARANHLTAHGEMLLSGRPETALGLLEQASTLLTGLYGPSCPLLPRLYQLRALAHASLGSTGAAHHLLDEATQLLDRLYADRPHQDRVAELRVRAALARWARGPDKPSTLLHEALRPFSTETALRAEAAETASRLADGVEVP